MHGPKDRFRAVLCEGPPADGKLMPRLEMKSSTVNQPARDRTVSIRNLQGLHDCLGESIVQIRPGHSAPFPLGPRKEHRGEATLLLTTSGAIRHPSVDSLRPPVLFILQEADQILHLLLHAGLETTTRLVRRWTTSISQAASCSPLKTKALTKRQYGYQPGRSQSTDRGRIASGLQGRATAGEDGLRRPPAQHVTRL
jgi:hypothetical protein